MDATAWLVVWLAAAGIAAAIGATVGGPGRRARLRWALWGLIFPPTAPFLLWRIARGQPAEGEPFPARAAPPPVPAPDPDDVDGIEGPFRACPRCGSAEIRMGSIHDGIMVAWGDTREVCARCDHMGPALEFRDAGDYARFVEELRRG